MKHLWIFVILFAASAFGQNAYGPDFLNLHCTTPDLNANTLFNIPPKPGLVPNVSANGNFIIYCDAPTGTLKVSVSGNPYSFLSLPLASSSAPEAFLSWNPGAVAANSCTTNTFGLRTARVTTSTAALPSVGDFVAPAWPSNLPANLVGIMRVSASDVIEVRLCNPTASPTTNPGVNLLFGAKVIR